MRTLAAMLAVCTLASAQSWRLAAPESVQTGDVVALRLTRDGLPQAGAAVRVAGPAREIASVRAATAVLREFPSAESAIQGTLYRSEAVLVTLSTAAGEWCGVLTAWGANGHVLCEALAIRPFGQPVGTTDADGRVLSRDLSSVPATLELVAERNGETLATAALAVKPDEAETLSPLAPGVALTERRFVRPGDGVFTVRALEFDPAASHLFLLPARAYDLAVGLEPVSNMVRRLGAIAGVNAGPFVPTGPYAGAATGAWQWNGKLLAASAGPPQPALLLCDPRSPVKAAIDHVELRATVTAPGGQSAALQGVNRPRGADDLVLFNPWFGPRTLTAAEGQEAVLDLQNHVSELKDVNAEIPTEGAVLSGAGAGAAFLRDHASVGSPLRIEASLAPATTPAVSGCDAADIIGAGRLLVADAAPAEGLEGDTRAPRAAFALTDRQTWLLVTVDGLQAASAGFRPREFAEELVRLGAVRAVELDSGAPVTLVANDAVRNSPSAGQEIDVAGALLVFSVQDLDGLRFLIDRVTRAPFQIPPAVTEAIQTSVAAALAASNDGDPAALRAAVEKLRADLQKMLGRELAPMPGRVLLRALDSFIATLPAIQPPPGER